MAFDGITIANIVSEMKKELIGGRLYKIAQPEEDELLLDILDEIYETFLISAVLSGALKIPDFWERKDDYFNHSFDKPPKPWIDPSKEATATQSALRNGQKTFKQIAAENGSDWQKQVDDICEVLKYARDTHGIDLGGVILGQKKTDGLYELEDDPPPGDDAAGAGDSPAQSGAADTGKNGGPNGNDNGGSTEGGTGDE